MDAYQDYRIKVLTWDTEVYNPQDFTADSNTDISEYEPGGGGGTDPHCVWEWLKENDVQPKKLIMFTDYQFFGWSPEQVQDYCDTVWIIKDNESAEPEFGIWAYYDDSNKD